MEIQFSLSENDYLEHQLFTASKSKRVKDQRKNVWIGLTILFLIIGLVFLDNEKKVAAYSSLGFGVLTFIFYPFRQRNFYRKHYLTYIQDTYKNRFDKVARLNFGENYIEIFDINGETKINYSAFEEINEIKDYIFLKLKTGGCIILPKLKIENLDALRIVLNSISNKYELKQNLELNWKWK